MLGLTAIAQRFFGSVNERKTRPMFKRVEEINALEPRFQAMSDEDLRAMTPAFRDRLEKGGRRSTSSCRKRSPWSARPPSGLSDSAISMSSWSAAWCCTKAASPR